MSESLTTLFKQHISVLQQRAQQAMATHDLDGLVIHSGEELIQFRDDLGYPFKVNPQFKYWVPVTQNPNCWLWIEGSNKPKLAFYSPVDYWHKVDPLPETFWSDEFDIVPLRNKDEIRRFLPPDLDKMAYLGAAESHAIELGFAANHCNPTKITNYFDYYRNYKTDYELFSMRAAQDIAIAGHQRARDAFYQGLSEFEINNIYLLATGQRDTNVPYGNIVALNENAAILHYTRLATHLPDQRYSFLLDAGAEYNGYAADITRSYAFNPCSLHAELIKSIDQQQQQLISTLAAGNSYIDYHRQMNQRLAKLLIQSDLLRGLCEEALVEQNITSAFMPHGLGHTLGLQVHDVAGFMQNDQGVCQPAPAEYPWLRCTRMLEPRMVVTIEPGLYFIESLLTPWRNGSLSGHFNWTAIDSLKPYGGIRIEDNIVIWDDRIENMTRNQHLD